MARGVITSPTVLRLYDLSERELEQLRFELHYKDGRLKFAYQKFRRGKWFAQKYGIEAYKDKLKEMQAEMEKTLLFEDDDGYWTYSGLAAKVAAELRCSIENQVVYPEPGALPWYRPPTKTARPYQQLSFDGLLAGKHAGVELATGLGKTFILTLLTKHLGLKTVVMAPSIQIAEQIYADFIELFGERKVGFVGDRKWKTGKQVTVAVAASLAQCEPGTKEWLDLTDAQVFIADESHLCPADTLSKVCLGLLKNAPYRFFFSATQLRNDGLDMLLDAITGPIVYRKTVQEGIAEGYLAALDFVMLETAPSPDEKQLDGDPNVMTKAHLFNNPNVYRGIADMINRFVGMGKRVLVLIDEMPQFGKLYPLLKYEVKFAHAKGRKPDSIPAEFHKSDPSLFVRQFNNEEFPILVGTSCICTGSDIKANNVTVYLRGGKSEIEIYQGAMGRSTRKFEYKDGSKKTRCLVVDVTVPDVGVVQHHAESRKAIYERVGSVKTYQCRVAA